MTKTRSTKRALLTSGLVLIMCITMLIGTTFTWFTDSVTSGNNKIVAGNLDIELEYYNGTGWATVNNATNLFGESLWEPGHTEVVYLKLSNKGSLALKYQLGIKVNYEKAGTNVAGKTFTLSNYIKMGVKEGVAPSFNNRAEAVAAVNTNAGVIASGYTASGKMLKGAADRYMAVVVYMPETVGNEANYKTGTEAPYIDFGINVLATQLTAEEDSFDNLYDADAPFSFWDGTVPTEMPASLVVDGATQTVHVKDAAAFAYLSTLSAKWAELYTDGNGTTYTNYANGAGADYYYSGIWTVSLDADIDLGNHLIHPVNIMLGESTGASTFDGNGHTIRNINTTTGLFADKVRAKLSNLVLVNVKATNGALIGSADHNISNVAVKNATISGTDYVGGLVGYAYAPVNGCTVLDSSVTASGKEAGGLIGYVVTSRDESIVTNNTVKNVNVYANNRAAGLVAQANVKVKVFNNTVDTVTVGATDTSKYQPNAVVSNALDAANVYDNTVNNATVTATAASANNNTSLKDAISGGADTVFIEGGEFALPTLGNETGLTIIGVPGETVVGGENTATGFGGNFGKDTTIKNVTFSGSSNGARWTYAKGGTSTFENCTFAGDSTYGIHIDQSIGATFIFNNCTFSGFNAFAGDLVKVVFNNCTFLNNGNYGHTNIWSVAEFNDCTFGDKTSAGPGNGSSAKLYFNGVEESYHHEFIGSADSLFAFAKSVNEGNDSWNGQKVVLVANVDLNNKLWTPIGQTGATQFKGIFDGQNFTIKNLKIDASAQTGANYSSGIFGWLNNATVKNLTVENATVTGNHNVAVIAGYMETAGCTINNCHVINATVVAHHANGDACGDKVGVIVGHAGNAGVKVENCTATKSTVTAGRDAGQIAGAAIATNVTGCAATDVTVTANGECTGANFNNAVIGRVL